MVNKEDGRYSGFYLDYKYVGTPYHLPYDFSIYEIEYDVYTQEVYTSHKFDITVYTNTENNLKLSNYYIFDTFKDAKNSAIEVIKGTRYLLQAYIEKINNHEH